MSLFYGVVWFLRGPISSNEMNHFLLTALVSKLKAVFDPCKTISPESHGGVIVSVCSSLTLMFWIWRLPCSSRENRGSFPSRLTPFFLQVTEGSGSPDAWHLNRAMPPTACVWLAGPCLMIGGGRSFRAEDSSEETFTLLKCSLAPFWHETINVLAQLVQFCHICEEKAWPYRKVLICEMCLFHECLQKQDVRDPSVGFILSGSDCFVSLFPRQGSVAVTESHTSVL